MTNYHRNASLHSPQAPRVSPACVNTKLWFAFQATSLCVASLLAGCAAARNHASAPYADPGRTRFESYCAGCHLNDGPWMRGEAPPLEGSSWVAGPENRLIKIVLHGLRGPIEVAGKTYNQEMPGFGQILTDAEIASLLSYVRKHFGEASARFCPRRSAGSAPRPRTGPTTGLLPSCCGSRERPEFQQQLGNSICVPAQTHFPFPQLCHRGNELR